MLDSIDLLELLHAEVLNLLQQLQVYARGTAHAVVLALSPGPLSLLFNVARKKARGGPGMRRHTVHVIIY